VFIIYIAQDLSYDKCAEIKYRELRLKGTV